MNKINVNGKEIELPDGNVQYNNGTLFVNDIPIITPEIEFLNLHLGSPSTLTKSHKAKVIKKKNTNCC